MSMSFFWPPRRASPNAAASSCARALIPTFRRPPRARRHRRARRPLHLGRGPRGDDSRSQAGRAPRRAPFQLGGGDGWRLIDTAAVNREPTPFVNGLRSSARTDLNGGPGASRVPTVLANTPRRGEDYPKVQPHRSMLAQDWRQLASFAVHASTLSLMTVVQRWIQAWWKQSSFGSGHWLGGLMHSA